jgi:hypothetical protein
MRKWPNIIHAAGRSFVKDAFTPSNVPETSSIVHSVEQ